MKMVILLLVVTTLLWGVTPILEKIGLTKVDPVVGITSGVLLPQLVS